jgi:hypothetical protein
VKIITTGHIFLSNYELSGFQNNQVNLYEILNYRVLINQVLLYLFLHVLIPGWF